MFFGGPTKYSKHPPKIANQESGKIAFPTFARSFAAFYAAPSHRSCRSRIPKHPPKTANQELRKMTSQLPRPSFAPSVCEYAIRCIMLSFHYN